MASNFLSKVQYSVLAGSNFLEKKEIGSMYGQHTGGVQLQLPHQN